MTRGNQPRQRVRPRTARRQELRQAIKDAGRAERRGKQVPPTVAGYKTALATRGFDGVAEALISRHNQRIGRFEDNAMLLQSVAMPVLFSALRARSILDDLGASRGRPPSFSGRTWPDHLAWGIDSISALVRLLIAMQPVGAALLARTQLERWSSNLEHNSDLVQAAGEDTTDWLTRLWASPGAPGPVRTRVVGQIYSDLSELLHGRGRLMPLVWLDVEDVRAAPSSDHVQLMDTITDAAVVNWCHIRACIAAAAEDEGFDAHAKTASMLAPIYRTQSWTRNIKPTIVPLIPSHFAGLDGALGAMEAGYLKVMSALNRGRAPVEPSELWPLFAFGDQRYRALRTARWAFEQERKMFGPQFDERAIENLATEAVLAGEMAAMLATWLRADIESRYPAAAFATCASALRSAHWLWMEDDDRAMGCLRCVIEQLARARAWRLKPERALKLEQSAATTPRDWLERSGWRRMGIMSRALGEFAHGSTSTNPNLARNALVELQDNTDRSESKFTGRTHAITVLTFMVSIECAAWVKDFDVELGEAYRNVIRINEQRADAATEALMNRAWARRNIPLR